MTRAILVVAELAGERPTAQSLELLALARGLAEHVAAIAFGPQASAAAAALVAAGADRVFVASDDAFARYVSDAYTDAITAIVREQHFDDVFACHTSSGADYAARVAFRLGGGVATGCVDVERVDGALRFTRPLAGGNARETLRFDASPVVALFRAGVRAPLAPDAARRGEIVALAAPAPSRSRMRVVEIERDDGDALRLEDARVVVAGGRGLGGPEGFTALAALADVLGGAVGASRVACDLGWCPHSWQIGLTGKSVTPALYIAVGISGASHHMAGCGRAQTIVAINSDPDAPIFKDARFGVIGDAGAIVPALAAELAEIKRKEEPIA